LSTYGGSGEVEGHSWRERQKCLDASSRNWQNPQLIKIDWSRDYEKPKTVCKDILIYFYLVIATQTLGALYREKILFILSNRSIVENGSSCPSI